MNLVIGITGASGVIYGIRLLEALKPIEDICTHVVISEYGYINLEIETNYSKADIETLADYVYDNRDLAAAVSSGSFPIDGVVIVPCSMKTLAGVANGYADSLINRVCDVALKEQRKLVMCPRETPLSAIHLENMLKLSRLGVAMVPPMPAFYNQPESIEDIINHHVMKIMDQFHIRYEKGKRWKQ